LAKISISIEGIDQTLTNLNYRQGSIKQKAISAIRTFYSSEDSIKKLNSIDTDVLIKSIWDVKDDPLKIKTKRRNFYSVKSSINRDLEKLSRKNKNPENITIADSNIFDMTEEAKSNLLSSFSDAVKTGDVDLEQATGLLKAVTDFLENIKMEDFENDSKDVIKQIKKILNKITGDVLSEEEDTDSTPGLKKLKDGENDFEDIEELDGDEELEEIEEGEELEEIEEDFESEDDELDDENIEVVDEEEDTEEIELAEDEEIEGDIDEIELDEDEELEEVEESGLLEKIQEEETIDLEDAEELEEDVDVEEIELDEDEELEEVEELDDNVEIIDDEDDIEEIELAEDEELTEQDFGGETENEDHIELEEDEELEEDVDVEEIELDEDEELEEIEELDDDVEEIELDEDEELEEVEELDEDELKALEEFREKKELAEHFDEILGDREKKYNKYATVPAGKYTIGTKKSLKSNLGFQQFDMPKVYISIYPVSNALFEIFIEETGYVTTAEKKGYGRVYYSRFKKNINGSTLNKNAGSEDVKGACWYKPSGPGSSLHKKRNHPVVQVSVDDAVAFVSWIGRRIPTEAEWESAARTDLGYRYPWGNEFDTQALNIEQCGLSDTSAVDKFDAYANEFKVVDMLGNVMEWTSDMEKPPIRSKKITKYCVAKGAAWNANNDVTISSRALFKPGFTSNTIGFRCLSEIS